MLLSYNWATRCWQISKMYVSKPYQKRTFKQSSNLCFFMEVNLKSSEYRFILAHLLLVVD